ncbi:MAG: ATP-binding protein [Cyanobacteriota bacterium]
MGNRFQAVSVYPRFSWQEALLNAIAHRNDSVQGNGIEVWLFDDRMEVVSPGGLLPVLNLQELLSRKRVHCSRNPQLMRTLVDLGLTRDQGEGIPRMFAEMEDAFLPAPRIEPIT